MKEIWKDIPNFEGLYQASNLGQIMSLGKITCTKGCNQYTNGVHRIKKQTCDKDGYLHVCLYIRRKCFSYLVSRLILLTFIGKSNLEVNHIDGDKMNNKLENLEYCTRLENEQHAWNTGLKTKSIFINKLQPVNQYDKTHNFIASYASEKEASLATNTKNVNISACINGKQHTSNGYIWEKPHSPCEVVK